MSDATFEDGAERPLRLLVADGEDLQVLSSLVQDSVLPGSEIQWDRAQRRLALLLNRFRWEHRAAQNERVQSLLVIEDVTAVACQGLDPRDREVILSLLDVRFEPGEDGQGTVLLIFAGDGALRVSVECLNLHLRDVTRPYLAPSGRRPAHPES